jgi:hypothetical protein
MQTKVTINVSAPFRAYLDKLTATDPRDRFASAKEALAALDSREALVTAKSPPKRRRRKWPLLVAGAAALVTGGGVAAFHALQTDDQPMGYIHLVIGAHEEFDAFVDGKFWGTASYDTMLHVPPGRHKIEVQSRVGTCSDEVIVDPGFTTRLDCEVGGAHNTRSPYDGRPVHDVAGQLRVRIQPDAVAKIVIDGKVSVVRDNQLYELIAGEHTIKIIAKEHTCEQKVMIKVREIAEIECAQAPTPSRFATLRFAMPAGVDAELFVDGVRVATVNASSPGVPITAGKHHIRLVGANQLACDDPHVVATAGQTTTLECNFGRPPGHP